MENTEELPYAVVKFLNDGSYSEVPVAWLTDDQFCYWPIGNRNVYGLMVKGVVPDTTTWLKHAVEVAGKYKTLRQARRKAEDSDYTTADETNLGKGKRKTKKAKTFKCASSHSESDESDISLPTAPSCAVSRTIHKMTDDSTAITAVTPEVDVNDIPIDVVDINSTTPIIIYEEPIASTSRAMAAPATPQNTFPNVELGNILRLCNSMHLKLLLSIDSRLERLENNGFGNQTSKDDPDDHFDKLVAMLPLKDVESMLNFDGMIKNENIFKAKYIQYIMTIGGRHTKDNIYRILKKTFENELGVKCSWLGQRNNVRVCDLQTIKIIKDVILKTSSIKEKEYETIASEWFRLSKLRLNRELKHNQN